MNNIALEEALREGVWAIAATPAGKYIGQLHGADHSVVTENKDYFIHHLTNPMKMRWPLEFSSNFVPRQQQTPQGPVLVLDRQIQANSISRCWNVEKLTITITPTDLFFFDDMSREDADWHRNLIRTGISAAWANRAKETKIILEPHHIQEGNA